MVVVGVVVVLVVVVVVVVGTAEKAMEHFKNKV